MKCDKCFYCAHIGAGIYASFPVKYCRRTEEYRLPFEWVRVNGELVQRELDFSNITDLKIWHEVGCGVHPSTVARAKRDFLKRAKAEVEG